MDELAQYLEEMFRVCIEEQNFALPLHLASVAANGTTMVTRHEADSQGGLGMTLLAEYTEGRGFQVPINIMIIDAGGEKAVRFLISKDSTLRLVH